jgi:hypothetical protein
MDRIELIKDLQQNSYKPQKRQSVVINNFFSLITIVMVCISIIYYVVYIIPAIDAKNKREQDLVKQEQYLEKRAKRIALSHKLNNINKRENNVSK